MIGGYAFLSDLSNPDKNPVNNNIQTITDSSPVIYTLDSNADSDENLETNTKKKHVNSTFSEELGLIMVGALIFIISFMWKDFITDFQHFFLSDNPSILARFLYTLVVSIFVVHLIVMIRNYLKLSKHGFLPSLDDLPNPNENE